MKKILLLSLLWLPFAASAQTDSIRRKTEELPGYLRLEQRFADYTLQSKKLQVSKKFEGKKFLDHVFFEAGGGINAAVVRSGSEGSPLAFGGLGKIALGDWVTPEHGWRVGARFGQSGSHDGAMTKAFTFDYLLNLSSLARFRYDADEENSRGFECYGILGLDLMQLTRNEANTFALSAHAGLRGQYRFTNYRYLFLEPQLALVSRNAVAAAGYRRMYPAASIYAGVGYRFMRDRLTPTAGLQPALPAENRTFLTGTFFSLAGGMSSILDKDNVRRLNGFGPTGMFGVGKWFTPVSGMRLTLGAAIDKQNVPHIGRLRSASLGADYLLNLDNLFGGKARRNFYVNLLAGPRIDFSYTTDSGEYNSHHTTFGFGAGAQFNARVSDIAVLFLEPRIDAHLNDFAPYASMNGVDVVPALLFGVSFNKSKFLPALRVRRAAEEGFSSSRFGRPFFEAAVGLGLPMVNPLVSRSTTDYLSPTSHVGIGTWLNPRHGVRLWSEASAWRDRPHQPSARATYAVSVGADYLWNITNTLNGYYEGRKLELVGLGGVNLGISSNHRRPMLGGGLGLQGLWNVTPAWSLYVEPQARVYGNSYLPAHAFTGRVDVTSAVMLGTRVHLLNGFAPRYGSRDDETSAQALIEDYILSAAVGAAVPGRYLRSKGFIGPMERLSFGRWNTPFTLWRVNFALSTHKGSADNPYMKAALGADYVFDVTRLANGYRADRMFSARAHLGADLGLDRIKGGGSGSRVPQTKVYFTPDVHIGGSLNFRVAPRFELYVEPQLAYQFVSAYDSRLSRFMPSILAGTNYQLARKSGAERSLRADNEEAWQRGESLLDHTFFSLSGGASVILDNDAPTGLHNRGPIGQLSVGKWFTPVSGLRFDLGSAINRQSAAHANRTRALYIGADYLLSLDNLFGGYRTRLFGVDLLAGPRVNFSATTGSGALNTRRATVGLTAGAQFHFRVSPVARLFLEPRVDVSQNAFAAYASESGPDVAPALLFGVSFNKSKFLPALRTRRAAEEGFSSSRFGRPFFEAAVGLGLPMVNPLVSRNTTDYLSPTSHVGIGTWLNPRHGVRLWSEASAWRDRPHQPSARATYAVAVGADYLWNITNTLNGYYEGRKLELVGLGGVNLGISSNHRRPMLGGGLGLQGLWNVTPAWSLYVEPQARVYGNSYLPAHAFTGRVDVTSAVMLGTRVHLLNGFAPRYDSRDDEASAQALIEDYILSAAAGAAVPGRYLRSKGFIGSMERLSFGRWNTPFTLWRVNFALSTHKGSADNPYMKAALGADYVFDVTRLANGYRADRMFSARAHLGADLGLDRIKGGGSGSRVPQTKVYFTPDVHIGGSLNFRVAPRFELYVEPQLAYQFVSAYDSRLSRFMPSVTAGFNYRLGQNFFKQIFGRRGQ